MPINPQVAAHACAAHETALAAELLSSLPRRREPAGTTGRRSPHPSSPWAGAADGAGAGVGGVFLSRGGAGGAGAGGAFAFQRSFLRARAELLSLLGACWGMCQVRGCFPLPWCAFQLHRRHLRDRVCCELSSCFLAHPVYILSIYPPPFEQPTNMCTRQEVVF